MSDQSSTSEPPTLDLFGNIIFSPGSADGPTRSTSPGGPATDPSGQDHHPVSRFRARDSDERMPTNDTSGPLFTNSSPSADLQRFLESRLRQSLAGSGSPEFALTWSSWDMGAGVPICRLRASAHRTSANGSSGSPWPTPMCPNKDAGNSDFTRKMEVIAGMRPSVNAPMAPWRSPAAQEAGITLERLVTKDGQPWTPGQRAYDRETGRLCETGLVQQTLTAAGWPTPNAVDGSIPDSTSENTLRRGDPNGTLRSTSGNLAKDAVLKVGWPTPQTHDVTVRGNTMADHHHFPHDLSNAAHLAAGWPTPGAIDATTNRDPPEAKKERGSGGVNLTTAAGWATPQASDAADSGSRNTPKSKAHSGYSLSDQARGDFGTGRLAGWPTPCESDKKGASGPNCQAFQRGDINRLADLVAGWPTPNTPNGGRSSSPETMSSTGMTPDGRKHTVTLEHVVTFAGWPTPNAMEGGQTSRSGERKDELLISGLPPSGLSASTEKRGALNPRFSLWLQGYPTGWAFCGEAVIRSSRKPPPSSSPP